jgi:hypothetical protein
MASSVVAEDDVPGCRSAEPVVAEAGAADRSVVAADPVTAPVAAVQSVVPRRGLVRPGEGGLVRPGEGGLVRPGPGVRRAGDVPVTREAVVPVELVLLALVEVAVGVDVRGVLDHGLVVGHVEPVVAERGVPEGDQGLLEAEHAGVHAHPLRTTGLVVEVDLPDPADLLAVTPVHGGATDGGQLALVDHGDPSVGPGG